jgi:pyruvate dehydrogenase E1 component alpha subunit
MTTTIPDPALDPAQARDLLRRMQTIRAFESRVEELFKAGELPGFVHSCAGQEATAVGVCSHLTPADYITSTHRGHGHAIAKGISLGAMFAELYGKATGACRGRGGSSLASTRCISGVISGSRSAARACLGSTIAGAGAGTTAMLVGSGAGGNDTSSG